MRMVKILFICHLTALVFGLGGLLIALPHPELWSNSPTAVEVFNFGIRYAGSLHILFGAAAVLLFGLTVAGVRRTLIFFIVSTAIPLGMELLGTGTGFPFGPYSYTGFLGFKVLGLVPYSIPLSWFYMGFTSFLLANVIVTRLRAHHQTACSLVLGVYFLTAWDFSLDPAMASQHLPLHFWIWHQGGPYFGMPVSNLIGWSLTGLLYMGLSRLLWRANIDARRVVVWFPCGIYAANTGFAIALTVSTGLWIPVLIAIVFGLLPASLVLWLNPAGEAQSIAIPHESTPSMMERISMFTVRQISRMLMRSRVQIVVEGLGYVPRSGPVLIAARHFHHLYDGCALLDVVPRRLHILVALDWIQKRWQCWLMERVCAMASWPVMLRRERLQGDEESIQILPMTGGFSAYTRNEFRRYLRRSVTEAVRLLRSGEALVVFPEGYPNIDPAPTPKKDDQAFLPFRPGFARLVEMAERDGNTQVAIIPAGFMYMQRERWHITLRFGQPLFREDYPDSADLVQTLERCVRDLSGQTTDATSPHTEETIQL